MKFTTFVLASAAATASAQFTNTGFNTGFNGVTNPFFNQQQGVAFSPYTVQFPQQQQYQFQQPVYQIQQPVDPLAWERDCTWVNAVGFRTALSRAVCGANTCQATTPNGNGGGYTRVTDYSKDTVGFHVWGSVINRAGRVCAVAYTGSDLTQQFPFGRIQAMKRANTANSLSLPTRAMPSIVADNHNYIDSASSDDLIGDMTGFRSVTGFNPAGAPGVADNGWYGFSHDRFNPGNIDVQFQGATSNYGEACGTTRQDPMCMQKPGGMDYSAGGLALYDNAGTIRGAIGVAGDNDCAAHSIAWKTREQLGLNFTPVNTDRATFNANPLCVTSTRLATSVCTAAVARTATTAGTDGTVGLKAYLIEASACELCDPNINAKWALPTAATTVAMIKDAAWSHTGVKAEDNAFFTVQQRRNFPLCYERIRQFQNTNPTRAFQGQSKA